MSDPLENIACRDTNPGRGPLGKELAETAPDHSSVVALAEECRREFAGSLNGILALELADWFAERLGNGVATAPVSPVLERVKLGALFNHLWTTAPTLENFALIYAYGFDFTDRIVGFMNMTDAARRFDLSKEMVRKKVEEVQTKLNLPKRKDQRAEEACEKMSQKAKERNPKQK